MLLSNFLLSVSRTNTNSDNSTKSLSSFPNSSSTLFTPKPITPTRERDFLIQRFIPFQIPWIEKNQPPTPNKYPVKSSQVINRWVFTMWQKDYSMTTVHQQLC